ncbi:MAG: leucine-rich repeat protein, partial [Muribaculaceae bacterium]|nr:leucine-rich repeat protein [Muribaculaceae bacterium]
TSVTIPNSVTEIGSDSFEGCNKIETLSLDCENIQDWFNKRSSLKSLILGDNVKIIGSSAFAGCGGLTSVTIPNSVSEIGSSAFEYCSSLTSVIIPNSVMSIGSSAFKNCSGLTSVTIGNSVTEIGSSAFYGCNGLTSLTIPNSVISIGSEAFYGCSGLTSVTIPNSVTSIGSDSFEGCNKIETLSLDCENIQDWFNKRSSLKSLILGDNVKIISSNAFYGCDNLTSFTIGKSVTTIGSNAFNGCRLMTEITIPESVTSIGSSAFYGCTGLKKASFASVESLCKINFENSSSNPLDYAHNLYINGEEIRDLIIPNSVTSIGSYAFSECNGLTSLKIADSVISIGSSAFSGCSGLTSLAIPSSVTEIGNYSFNGCLSLKEITIQDGEEVLTLGYSAGGKGLFYDCPFETLYLGRNLSYETGSSYGYSPFYKKETLKILTISDSTTSLERNLFLGCNGLTSVTIGNSVTSIGSSAFKDCSGLNSVRLGAAVTSIGENAFEGCELDDIYTFSKVPPTIYANSFSPYSYSYAIVATPDSSLEKYKIEWSDFVHFRKNSTDPEKEYIYTVDNPGDLLNLIDADDADAISKLKLIGEINGTDLLVLNKMINITSLDLSEATIVSGGMPYYDKDNERFGTEDNTLGNKWAYNLNLIKELLLPENLITIGSDAFSGKEFLTSLIVPDSVTSIGESAFSACKGLTCVTIGNSVTKINNYAFNGCTALKELTFKEGDKILSLGYNDYSNSNRYNGKGLFYDCPLEILYEGRNLSYDSSFNCGYSPFYHNVALKTITVGDSVTSIGSYAFSGCNGLTTLTIGDSVTTICSSAFSGCDSLTSLSIPNSVTTIGSDSFKECSGLESVTIGNSVTTIGSSAFQDCNALTSLTIPGLVTEIGNFAFNGCSSLKELTIEDGIKPLSLGYNYYSNSNNNKGKGLFNDSPLETLYIGRDLLYDAGSKYGFSPFYNKGTLTTITLGNAVTRIYGYTFSGCSGLLAVTLGTSVSYIGESAFADCSNLSYISIPDPVNRLLASTFSGCSLLKEISLPGSMREIASNTFSGCTALERVSVINPIPPVIESSTFAACPATTTLYIPNGSKNIYWIHPYWGKFKTIANLNVSEDFSVENLTYHITSEEDATVEISAANLISRAGNEVIEVPSEVMVNDKTYRVTGIANNGFEGASIASIFLPETISYVGLEAFKDCDLTEITCMAMLPPSVNSNSFYSETYNNATLTIPKKALEAYRAHEVWQKFANMSKVIMIESLSIDPEEYEAAQNTQFRITATVLPEDATDKQLEWSSSDETVATVDQDGLVTILNPGECIITVRTTDGSDLSAECRLYVTTGIENVSIDDSQEDIEVFNMNGFMISNSIENLAPDIYIVRKGNTVKKIIVK